MLKKFFCCIMVILIITLPFSLSVSAEENVEDVISFGSDLVRKWIGDAQQNIMNPDDFYDTYIHTPITSSELALKYWQEYMREARRLKYFQPKIDSVYGDFIDGVLETGENQTESYYKTSKLNRSQLATLSDFYGSFEFSRGFHTIADLKLVAGDSVNFDDYIVPVKNYCIDDMGSQFRSFRSFDSYYDISVAQQHIDTISFYTGGTLPPAVFIPSTCTLYQNNVKLPSNAFYIILGDNLLLKTVRLQPYIYFFYYNSGQSVYDLTFGQAFSNVTPVSNKWYNTNSCEYYSSGAISKSISSGTLQGWEVVDLLQKMHGYVIYSSSDDFPEVEEPVPDNLPSDSSGDVIVMIPYDIDNNNVTEGDVIYMNPQTYNNYVNNGNIVNGDYINDYSSNIQEDIVNNYYSYVINDSNYYFDDGNILDKLDIIIDEIRSIKSKIGTGFTTFIEDSQINSIFSSEPCYNNFTDCITNNIPIINTVTQIVNDINDNNIVAVSAVSELTAYQSDNHNDKIKSIFNGFTINLSWYDPYRITIRNLLRACVYIFGITTLFSIVKSVFGIQLGGGVE